MFTHHLPANGEGLQESEAFQHVAVTCTGNIGALVGIISSQCHARQCLSSSVHECLGLFGWVGGVGGQLMGSSAHAFMCLCTYEGSMCKSSSNLMVECSGCVGGWMPILGAWEACVPHCSMVGHIDLILIYPTTAYNTHLVRTCSSVYPAGRTRPPLSGAAFALHSFA